VRLTPRDIKVVRDVVLSHVLSRDQVVSLGYFGSYSRANVRLKLLADRKFLRVITTPFFGQHLYAAGSRAADVAGDRISGMIGFHETPQFIRHALAVTDIRVACAVKLSARWLFERQVRDSFSFGGRIHEVRPDGVLLSDKSVTFLEADLGHVSAGRFAKKIQSYQHYVSSGAYADAFPERTPNLLTVTTGLLRQSHLLSLTSDRAAPRLRVTTFSELGICLPGGWS